MAIDKFKLWCIKYIIPIAYDESLSYYQQLVTIADKVNELIENENLLAQEIAELEKNINEIVTTIVNDALKGGEILVQTEYNPTDLSLKFTFGKIESEV